MHVRGVVGDVKLVITKSYGAFQVNWYLAAEKTASANILQRFEFTKTKCKTVVWYKKFAILCLPDKFFLLTFKRFKFFFQ